MRKEKFLDTGEKEWYNGISPKGDCMAPEENEDEVQPDVDLRDNDPVAVMDFESGNWQPDSDS